MRGCVRRSERIGALVAGWLCTLAAGALADTAPQRVVSMNLCTDQVAMMLAAPGQLISVSDLASNPRMSPMADQAGGYAVNHGRAEEIYLMRPDLVLAGQFTAGPTVAMLRRLGIRVEVMPPAESIEAIRAEITRFGDLLGRHAAAADLLASFDADLAAASADGHKGRAALYYANGFTSGPDTLAGSILTAAGWANIATEYGITGTTTLPMELLVMAAPDRLITGARWPGQSRSEAILEHPALADAAPGMAQVTDRDWICGTPFILRAIEDLG